MRWDRPNLPVGAWPSGGTGPPCLWEPVLEVGQGSLACGSPAFRGTGPTCLRSFVHTSGLDSFQKKTLRQTRCRNTTLGLRKWLCTRRANANTACRTSGAHGPGPARPCRVGLGASSPGPGAPGRRPEPWVGCQRTDVALGHGSRGEHFELRDPPLESQTNSRYCPSRLWQRLARLGHVQPH